MPRSFPLPFRAALRVLTALRVLGLRSDEPLVPRLGMFKIPAGEAMWILGRIRSPEQWVHVWEQESRKLLGEVRAATVPDELRASGLRQAASMLRVAEYMATDDDQRRDLWQQILEINAAARRVDRFQWARLEVPVGQASCPIDVCLPKPGSEPAPLVLTLGGVDAAKEEFIELARLYASLGWASAAVDLPGQGEARRCRGLTWQTDPVAVLPRVIDALETLPSVRSGSVAVVGGSLGGFFAAGLAMSDPRVTALATLCSPAKPLAVFTSAPRPIPETMMYNLGVPTRRAAIQELRGWNLPLRLTFTGPHFALTSGDDSTSPLRAQQALVDAVKSPLLTRAHYPRGDHMCFRFQTSWELRLRRWLSDVTSTAHITSQQGETP
ncbi:alpha/beta hydrolase family protein [Cutibacterium sp. V947]|uniref:alpha/beta hydrolase family protein n=1 Tax=Cutibacterium sp. V947 TaxID=3446480 RepID=UPI003EE14F16